MGNRGMRRCGAFAAMVVVLAALLASGCGRDPGGQLPRASGEKLQAEREAPAGFALVRAWADQHEGRLALALEFSRPLVGTQDFDALLKVEPAGNGRDGSGWTLSDDGKVLRYPFVEAARDYTVTLAGALLAADGSRLEPPLEQAIHTGELEPVAGFASQGSVLPARESRGLPVVSVNVDEVDVEFLRVREDALPRFFAAAGHQDAAHGRAGGAAAYPRQRQAAPPSGGDPVVLARGERPGQELGPGRERLRGQAGGHRPVLRRGQDPGPVLGSDQRHAGYRRLSRCRCVP